MDRVETIVTQIQGLSSSPDDWGSLHTQLENGANDWPPAAVDAVLAHLNPAEHTVGYIFFLHVRAKALGPDGGDDALMRQTKEILLTGHAQQLKFMLVKVQELCEAFTVACRRRSEPLYGVKALKVALEKVQFSSEHLTTIHHNLLQLCLLSKNFKPAEEILEGRVIRVNKEGLQARDVLLYLYYGGMVFAALKRFQRAFDTFQLAFAMPCQLLNEIMAEIYKKYILVSLIVHGEVVPLPKYTTNILQRMLKGCCAQYHDIATAFATLNVEDVRASIDKHRHMLTQDKNLGLANQAMASIYTRNIQRLTQTFVTLSLADIAEQVKLPDADAAKTKILEMMDKGQIVATIDQEKGMASFNTSRISPAELLNKLTEQIQYANELNEKLREVEEGISSNPAYLTKVAMQEQKLRWGEPAEWASTGVGGSSEDMMDLGEKPPGFSASLGAK